MSTQFLGFLFLAIGTTFATPVESEPPPKFAARQVSVQMEPPPKFTSRDYTACLAAVERGDTVYLAVGVEARPGDYTIDKLKDTPPGRYECWKKDGVAVFAPVENTAAAPEVRPFMPFPSAIGANVSGERLTVKSGSAVADHHCPSCGYGPWYNVLSFNSNGTHNHQCQNCGSVFSH